MSIPPLLQKCSRRRARRAREAAAKARDAVASEKIRELRVRKDAVEGYLVPRQRRNHWQESIAEMISGGT